MVCSEIKIGIIAMAALPILCYSSCFLFYITVMTGIGFFHPQFTRIHIILFSPVKIAVQDLSLTLSWRFIYTHTSMGFCFTS